MIAYFERFTIQMTKTQARECSHPGDCAEDVKALLKAPRIKAQFKRLNPDDIKAELSEYGAWDSAELSDAGMNQVRILWIAAGNIREEYNL